MFLLTCYNRFWLGSSQGYYQATVVKSHCWIWSNLLCILRCFSSVTWIKWLCSCALFDETRNIVLLVKSVSSPKRFFYCCSILEWRRAFLRTRLQARISLFVCSLCWTILKETLWSREIRLILVNGMNEWRSVTFASSLNDKEL